MLIFARVSGECGERTLAFAASLIFARVSSEYRLPAIVRPSGRSSPAPFLLLLHDVHQYQAARSARVSAITGLPLPARPVIVEHDLKKFGAAHALRFGHGGETCGHLGLHWRDALGHCRYSAVISPRFRNPALDEGDNLLKEAGHVAREAPDQLGYRVAFHPNPAISPRMRKAAQRDGSRPESPMLALTLHPPVHFLCHR
jgi:hypothetical protein